MDAQADLHLLFAYGINRFSHDVAQFIEEAINNYPATCTIMQTLEIEPEHFTHLLSRLFAVYYLLYNVYMKSSHLKLLCLPQ